MSDVIDLSKRRKKDEPVVEGVKAEAAPNPLEEERFAKLNKYLAELDLTEALKTAKENTEGAVMPRELAKINMDKIKSVGTDIAEKAMLEEIQSYLERKSGQPLNEQESRALHNYVVLSDAGNFIIDEGSLCLPVDGESTNSNRVMNLECDIRNRKLEIIREFLGADIIGHVDKLEERMEELWKDEDWREALSEAKDSVKPDESLESPLHFLEHAAHLAGIVIGDDRGTNVRELGSAKRDKEQLRKIEEAYRAYSDALTGVTSAMPWLTKRGDNNYWNAAGERQCAIRDDLAHKQALKTVEYLKRSMGLELVKQDLEVV